MVKLTYTQREILQGLAAGGFLRTERAGEGRGDPEAFADRGYSDSGYAV